MDTGGAPITKATPAALAFDAGQPQPFLDVVLKGYALAEAAVEADCEEHRSGVEIQRFEAFIRGLTEHRAKQVRVFILWGQDGAVSDQPDPDLSGFAQRVREEIAIEDEVFGNAYHPLLTPYRFTIGAYCALHHADRLGIDIERVFPPKQSQAA